MVLALSKELILLIALVSCSVLSVFAHGNNGSVTYDGRSLIINGKRLLLFSGSIHYPRMPPEMWPDVLKNAKKGGLNVIQTYVFWDRHEPIQGQFNFEGNYDLVKYIKMIGENDMYVTLRVGPFIEAEWNFGGFPYWLKEVPNITFRTDNPPFKYHMKKFTKMIIEKMKNEKLFASQGGPIILSQIENEYNTVELAYRKFGTRYIQWAGNMAVGLKTGVPWVMCKQKDAPDPVINTCNGRNCGDTFTGPNKPNKPILWTENWTAQYRVFGDPPSQRAVEDVAFSVARFFSKSGTLANYYMYYGGTNYGRTTSSFVTTRYYDEAPLDEYGLVREPKWGHLRDLHSALKLCQKALLWGHPSTEKLGKDLEARVFEKPGTDICVAFLSNNHTRVHATVTFRGAKYNLPPHSISILPDCKTVAYNTQTIVAQHSARNYKISKIANNLQWTMFKEIIPTPESCPLKTKKPLELTNTTKDTTDYLWYGTSVILDKFDLPFRDNIIPVLQVANLGHLMHAFANGEYIGTAHGNNVEKSFVFRKPIILKTGMNNISLLCATVGLPDSGAYMEHRFAGLHAVSLLGLNTGTLDLTLNGWGHKVGLDGENHKIITEQGANKFQWTTVNKGPGQPLTWYKAYFDAPEGNDPVAIQMGTMSKGMVWVNGNSIGRFWVSFHSPLGKPSQSVYHIPRAFIKPTKNLMVVLEEIGGDPYGIKLLTVNRDTICGYLTEYDPPNVKSWKRAHGKVNTVVDIANPTAILTCPDNKKIVRVEFASYGNPFGACGRYNVGHCNSPTSQQVVEQYCLGKTRCAVPMDQEIFGKDEKICPHVPKTLAIQVHCGNNKEGR